METTVTETEVRTVAYEKIGNELKYIETVICPVVKEAQQSRAIVQDKVTIQEITARDLIANGANILNTYSAATAILSLITSYSIPGKCLLTIVLVLNVAAGIGELAVPESWMIWFKESYMLETFPSDYPGYSVREWTRQSLHNDSSCSSSSTIAGPKEQEDLLI